jgi:hypothetical protein
MPYNAALKGISTSIYLLLVFVFLFNLCCGCVANVSRKQNTIYLWQIKMQLPQSL